MTDSLFRREVIEQRRDRLYGEVLIIQPISFYIITAVVVVVTIFVSILLTHGTYARRETVQGFLTPDKGLIKIYATERGILTKRHIKEGALVEQGDILFSVSTRRFGDSGSDNSRRRLSELTQQKSMIQKKLEQEELLNEAKHLRLSSTVTGLSHEQTQLEEIITTQRQQIVISKQSLDNSVDLMTKGHLSSEQHRQVLQTHLDKTVDLQNAKRQLTALVNKKLELQQKITELPLQWQTIKADIKDDLSKLNQVIFEVTTKQEYTIKAAISGYLTTAQIEIGQTVKTDMPLVSIIPKEAQLYAELYLPTRAAGFVLAGQTVWLRYGAFPYQHYGLYRGEISEIAQTITPPEELPKPMRLNDPVYRVKVALDSQQVHAFGKSLPLQVGMLLDANIILEERSLGQWLLGPVYGLRGRI
jgi:membrane fusion protein